jgi:hypothetical protein
MVGLIIKVSSRTGDCGAAVGSRLHSLVKPGVRVVFFSTYSTLGEVASAFSGPFFNFNKELFQKKN